MGENQTILTASGIRKRYGKKEVLKDITFSGRAGQCIGIFGENGCGKSTLLSILAGAQHADGGSLSYVGQDPFANPRLFSSLCAYVPQDNPLIGTLTVNDNLSLWYTDRAAREECLATGLGARFGLTQYARTEARKLSGGMKKRLSIVCALAGSPDILLLDEPTAALDIACKEDIRSYVREYTAAGGLVLLTTHEAEDFALCDQAYFMEGGVLSELPVPLQTEVLLERMNHA